MFVGCQPFSHVAKDFCRPNGRRRSAQVPPVRARGGFDSPAPALPPCFAWRAKQARLTQVTADVRLLEQATVAQKRAWPFLPPGAGFWYAAAALISDVVARFDPTTDRLALLLKLQERRAEAQQLDAAILRERIASLPVPELEQIQVLGGSALPRGFVRAAPRAVLCFHAHGRCERCGGLPCQLGTDDLYLLLAHHARRRDLRPGGTRRDGAAGLCRTCRM